MFSRKKPAQARRIEKLLATDPVEQSADGGEPAGEELPKRRRSKYTKIYAEKFRCPSCGAVKFFRFIKCPDCEQGTGVAVQSGSA